MAMSIIQLFYCACWIISTWLGVYRDRAVLLTWETDNEIRLDHFEVYKNDALIATLGTLKGGQAEGARYWFTDQQIRCRTSYTYTLKAVSIGFGTQAVNAGTITPTRCHR